MASRGRRAPHSKNERDDQRRMQCVRQVLRTMGHTSTQQKGCLEAYHVHFHTRAIVLGRPQEGGRRCDKSKANNADRASDTAHSGAPAFSWKPKTTESASERCSTYMPRQASECEHLLVDRAAKWEHPRTVPKSYLSIYKKGASLTEGCAVADGHIRKHANIVFENDTMPCCLESIYSEMV
jgi:hypothetical protein